MPAVAGLHLHPVKACGRVEVERATVGELGLVGDREWQVCGADGAPLTQRTHPALATVRPEPVADGLVLRAAGAPDQHVPRPPVDAEPVTVTELTGTAVELVDAGDEAAAWFGGLVDAEVRLLAIGPSYRRPVAEPFHAGWTQAALGDLSPVLLANRASLGDLVTGASEPFGMERFRPNIVVEGIEAWDEDTWRTVRVGGATVRGCLPWPRCAVPQVDQETGERHREPARVLADRRRCVDASAGPAGLTGLFEGSTLFGVGAGIEPVGVTIAVGDPVEVIERGPAFEVNGTP